MNCQGPDGIDWTDWTWNPVTGCWGPGGTPEEPRWCPHCYAKKMAEGRLRGRAGYDAQQPFAPTFHEDRLYEPVKEKRPSKIFVSSMGDLFGDWVPREWIKRVLDTVRWCNYRGIVVSKQGDQGETVLSTEWQIFQFLTQNPKRLAGFNPWPKNCWVGATATGWAELTRAIDDLQMVDAPVRFVSCEPLLQPIRLALPTKRRLDWAIIGACSGRENWKRYPQLDHGQPPEHWVRGLTDDLHAAGARVWHKGNLKRGWLKEWPSE